MSPRYTTVQVRVDEGVLWVGGEAYPLRNISHVGTHTLRVDKASAWWRFVRRTVICLTFGGGLAALAGANWTVLPAAVETLLVWRHVRIISAPALYGLVLVTSGIQRDALWSADSRQMEDLVHAITMALARPDTVRATHEIQAVTASIVRQLEGESVGKAAHSGRGGDIQGGATSGGWPAYQGKTARPVPDPRPVQGRPRPEPPADEDPEPPEPGPHPDPGVGPDSSEPRSLVAELAEQTSPGREVPLHVQIVRGRERGARLRSFAIHPRDGSRVVITLHAPGLVVIGELQQELHVMPGQDSDVLRFRLKAPAPGLHQVTVRAFRGGTFLGEVTCQMSVEFDSVTRDGPRRHAPLPSMAFDPGEVTLQVEKDEAAGTFRFQLIGERFHAPETFHFRGGDPGRATEQIYAELRRAAKDAARSGGDGDGPRLRGRLRNHGVQLWTSAVPRAVQRQFWDEADRIAAFTVLGEHDIVPWELLYPLNEGREDRGFLSEWLPVVRRVFGQDRVRSIGVPGAAFVVPPGSPADAWDEVTSLRATLGKGVADGGVLTERAALTALIEGGPAGLLHFACHNAFTGSGSCVTMADGPFDPIDLAWAAQLRTLRTHRPLVFFNACRSAGEIDWFGESLGWAPQFLNAGAGAFVGTLWPVRSRSALQFAETFYDQLIAHGQPLGRASVTARHAVRDLHDGDPTWLAYAVYGSPAATAHTNPQGE